MAKVFLSQRDTLATLADTGRLVCRRRRSLPESNPVGLFRDERRNGRRDADDLRQCRLGEMLAACSFTGRSL